MGSNVGSNSNIGAVVNQPVVSQRTGFGARTAFVLLLTLAVGCSSRVKYHWAGSSDDNSLYCNADATELKVKVYGGPWSPSELFFLRSPNAVCDVNKVTTNGMSLIGYYNDGGFWRGSYGWDDLSHAADVGALKNREPGALRLVDTTKRSAGYKR